MTNENQNILRIKQLMLLKESQEKKSPADLLWDFINNEEDVDGSWISSRHMDYEKDGYFYFDFDGFKEYYEYFFPESENEDTLQNWEWALNNTYSYFEDDYNDSEFETESHYYDSLDDKIKEKLKSLVTEKLGFRFKDTENVGLKIQEIFTALGLADAWVSEYDHASRVARTKDFEKKFNEENCDYLSKIGLETLHCFRKYRMKPEHLLVMYSVVGDENLEYDELIVKYLQKKNMDAGLQEPYEFYWEQWNEEEFESEYNGEFRRVLKKFKEIIEDASPKQIKKFGKTLKKVDDLGGFEHWIETGNGDRIMFLSYDMETDRVKYKFNKKNDWRSQVGTADIDTLLNKIKNLELDF